MFVHERLVNCVLARIDVRPATKRSNFNPNMIFENVVRFAHVKSKAAQNCTETICPFTATSFFKLSKYYLKIKEEKFILR